MSIARATRRGLSDRNLGCFESPRKWMVMLRFLFCVAVHFVIGALDDWKPDNRGFQIYRFFPGNNLAQLFPSSDPKTRLPWRNCQVSRRWTQRPGASGELQGGDAVIIGCRPRKADSPGDRPASVRAVALLRASDILRGFRNRSPEAAPQGRWAAERGAIAPFRRRDGSG